MAAFDLENFMFAIAIECCPVDFVAVTPVEKPFNIFVLDT
jgi:hypothetical protein